MRAGLIVLLALLCAHPSGAQQREPIRIGYVDMKRLLDNAPQVVRSRERLQLEFAAQNSAIESDQARLSALEDRLERDGVVLSAEQLATAERERDALRRSLRRARENLREALARRRDEELADIERLINEAVIELARAEDYDLIVPSPVVYASPRVDLTERVLEALRRVAAGEESP